MYSELTHVIVGDVVGGELGELHLLELLQGFLARDLGRHLLAQTFLALRPLHNADLLTSTTLGFCGNIVNRMKTGGAHTILVLNASAILGSRR